MSILSRLRVFRRLQWKLTLTYTLVTSAAILVVEVILLLVAWGLIARSGLVPRLFVPVFEESVREIAPALERTPPDTAHIQRWLQALVKGQTLESSDPRRRLRVNIGPAMIALAAVTDVRGRSVAAYPEDACPPGRPVETCLAPAASAPLQAALAGVHDPRRLAIRTSQDMYVMTPIVNRSGTVVGVLAVYIRVPQEWNEFPRAVVSTLFFSGLLVFLLTIPVGTLFGFLTARGLARRLRALAEASEAWRRGDFSAVVHDTSQDELGQLARHLNSMAEALEGLLQARQELAAMEERHRLARDLHDSVKQQVFATAMQVAAARNLIDRDPRQAKVHLAEAERLAKQAQQELTALIRELRPAALAGKGLVAALNTYVADWSKQTGIRGVVRARGARPLPLHVEQTLFRIVQEALSNVAKHSAATETTVSLTWEGDRVVLEVEDNGRGFDVRERWGKGIGLQSMEERVQQLGGTWHIESTPGKGTRIRVVTPV